MKHVASSVVNKEQWPPSPDRWQPCCRGMRNA